MRGLVSVAAIKAVLPGASESVIRMRIRQATDRVQQACQRKFGLRIFPEDAGEVLEVRGREWLEVSAWPIRHLDRLLVDDVETEVPPQAELYPARGCIDVCVGCGVVRAEYAGGYILPGDGDLTPNRAAGHVAFTVGQVDYGKQAVVRGLSTEGTVIETVTLGASAATTATFAAYGVWEVEVWGHVSEISVAVDGQTLGKLSPCKNILAACDVPGDLEELAMDLATATLARPVKGIRSETIPGGGSVAWSTPTPGRSEIDVRLAEVKGTYGRGFLA